MPRLVRLGFTLVELLVAIAVIGVLISLLIPAVQKIRDSAARMQCANNLKQIILAVHAYENVNKTLPMGLDQRLTCAFVPILPYLDQRGAFDNFDFKNGPWWSCELTTNIPTQTGTPPGATGLWGAEGQFSVFLCPAAPGPSATNSVAQVRVMGISGTHYPVDPSYAPPRGQGRFNTYNFTQPAFSNAIARIGRSNYLLSSGYLDTFDDYLGLFTWQKKVKIRNISDGSSNTIAIMESAGGFIDFTAVGLPDASGWGAMPWAHAFVASNVGVCPDSANPNCVFGSNRSGLAPGLPGSLHASNRINTAYADGSIRSIPGTLDFELYVYLCGYRDGQNVSPE